LSTVVPIDGASRRSALGAAISKAAAAAHERVRTRWWVELLAVGWLLWLYDLLTNAAPLRLHSAVSHAGSLLSAERALHIDPELSLDRWLAPHHTLALVVSDYYDNAHFIVTLGLLGLLWWRRADIYRPLRNTLVLVNLIAFAVFWRYPVAPPRMLGGFVDVVASSHAIGSWHSGALATHADELAAMPSLHMAWAAWCSLVVWRMTGSRRLRALAVAYPLLTAFAVLATGNHFVLDILAGLGTLALAVALLALGGSAFGRLLARRPRPRLPLGRGARA
jgi:PAP2 superfamily